MKVWHIVGVDPGLVHTGVVRIIIGDGEITLSHALVEGPNPEVAAWWIYGHQFEPDRIFIEKYEPRYHFSADGRMVQAEAAFKKKMKDAKLTPNAGIKRIVTPQVLSLMGLWDFKTRTHHQDLRAAARIAVLGLMKDLELNKVLSDLVRDTLDGSPWTITDLGGGTLSGIDELVVETD